MGSWGGEVTEAGCSQGLRPNTHGHSWFPGSGMGSGNHDTCWCFIRPKVSAAVYLQISERFTRHTFVEQPDTECWVFICCKPSSLLFTSLFV